MISTATNPTMSVDAPISIAVLENLAARVRVDGLFLLALNSHGKVVFEDSEAGLFFQRYVLPLIQWGQPQDMRHVGNGECFTGETEIAIWNFVPGVTIAAFAHRQRKVFDGLVILAGKSTDFSNCEDVLRVCGRLGLDARWLESQAAKLPCASEECLRSQARMFVAMLDDQLRVSELNSELQSLSVQLSTTYEELNLIYQLSSGMRVNRESGDFFKQVCLDVAALVGTEGMGVVLRNESGAFEQPVMYGSLSLPPGTVHRVVSDLMTRLRETPGPLLINDLATDKTFGWLSEHAHQLIAVPLQRRDQLLGCLFGLDKSSGEFDSVDSKLLNSIANESAIYLENSMLYENVRGLMMGLLHCLVNAVDAKDTYTCGHSERVALVSRELAQEAGLDAAVVDRIYMAGLLHDVGKIGVSEGVLQKSGALTNEEFQQIKKHPEIGARILRDIKQIQDILPGVLHHHERYDGRGYPFGLAGEAIPMMGRIICLADCFDAMTSSRTYRKAMPIEAALTEIRRCAGTQFDPMLADAFLKIGPERFKSLLADHGRQTQQLIGMQPAPSLAA